MLLVCLDSVEIDVFSMSQIPEASLQYPNFRTRMDDLSSSVSGNHVSST